MDAQQRIAELEAALAAKDAEFARVLVAKDAEIAALTAQVAALIKQVAELTEKLGQNSRNSHLPPSSDPPGSAKPGSIKQRSKSERKRGGQRGHRGTRRQLVPEDQVNEFVDLYPAECENCWATLPEVPDPIRSGTRPPRSRRSSRTPRKPAGTPWRAHAAGTRPAPPTTRTCPCGKHA